MRVEAGECYALDVGKFKCFAIGGPAKRIADGLFSMFVVRSRRWISRAVNGNYACVNFDKWLS
jgi:chromate transport protein ChrA